MLWRIEHQLRSLAWGMGDPKKRDKRPPEPIPTPGQLADIKRRRESALRHRREIDMILGMEAGYGD